MAHGLCVNSDFVFVADTYNNRIQKFEVSGFAYHSQIGTLGVGHDQMYHPSGVALDGPYLSIVEDLGCRLQLRLADSLEFVRMSWDVLDDNTGDAWLHNTSPGYYQLFYKLHTLAALDYAVFFLAYDPVYPYGQPIDGSVLTPFASTGSDNQVTDVTYTWLYSGVYLCCARFTGTAATWKVGSSSKPSKPSESHYPDTSPCKETQPWRTLSRSTSSSSSQSPSTSTSDPGSGTWPQSPAPPSTTGCWPPWTSSSQIN